MNNLSELYNYINKSDSLEIINIPSFIIFEIIKQNKQELIKLIFSHLKFNYSKSYLSRIFTDHRRELIFDNIFINNDYLLENVDDNFIEGIIEQQSCFATAQQ